MDERQVFEARLRLEIKRALRDYRNAGGDVRDLGNAVMLRFDGGELVEVAFDNPATKYPAVLPEKEAMDTAEDTPRKGKKGE